MREEIAAALERMGLEWVMAFAEQGFEDLSALVAMVLS